jgi:diaminopimelate epimerase
VWTSLWAGQEIASCIGSIVWNHRSASQIPEPAAAASVSFGRVGLTLTKYEALGNDYLVLDLPAPLARVIPLLPRICDRHLGPGSDGLLAFDPATLSIRIFNPDSSEAQKSGNGLRIAAAHALLEHGFGERFELGTPGRQNPVRILARTGATVVSEVDIGPASFRAADLPANVEGEPGRVRIETRAGPVEAVLVSVGNPHCVVLDQPVTRERCLELGPLLEADALFPERVNVQLAEALDLATARCEIWERGAGYTLASGTSASAVAAALMREGLVGEAVEVRMPGGVLSVRRLQGGSLRQRGPARRVCRVELDLDDFEEAE